MQRQTDLKILLNQIKPHLRFEMLARVGDTPANKQLVNKYVNALFENNTAIKRLMLLVGTVLDQTAAKIRMNKAQYQHFINERLLGEDCISAAINSILGRLSQRPSLLQEPINDDDFNLTELIRQLPEELSTSLTSRYSIIDDRVVEIEALSVNDNTFVRRLTSLSRMFRFDDTLSVCSAVTFHKGEILLACNSSSNTVQKELIEKAMQRMQVLRKHLQNVKQKTEEVYHRDQIEINTATCDELLAIYPSVFGAALTIAALDKITDAILFDPDTFSPEIKAIFMEKNLRFRVIVPVVQNGRDLSILCTGHENPICTNIKTDSVSYAHAEQLLAFYIRDVLGDKIDKPGHEISYGITKLCCQVCRTQLGPYAKVYGTHGENEPTTLRLLGGKPAVVDKAATPKRFVTQPPPSPQTAEKKREVRVLCNSFAKRSSLFSSSEEGDEKDDKELPDTNPAPTKKNNSNN